MLQLAVFCLILYFCKAEYYQDEPMGHFMEYSVEMPSSSSSRTSEPTMFMRYGNIDKSGRYLRDFEIERPSYHHPHIPPPPSSAEEEYNPTMPPFPFSLPYQYIDAKRYPKPELQSYNSRPWNNNNNEREYSIGPNRNSWARIYPSSSRDSYHLEQPKYFEPHHQARYVPTRYSSTVDEIQNRVFSMMQNIAAFSPASSSHGHQLPRGGHHRSGYSRESQYGYQMFI